MPKIIGAAITGTFSLPLSELAGKEAKEKDAEVMMLAATKFKTTLARIVAFSSGAEGDRWVVSCGTGQEIVND